MTTIGNLIDQLTIANIRIWMLEDIKRSSLSDKKIADATRKTNIVNQQRNDLIQQIDEIVNWTAEGYKQKLYSQGDTKLYG